ncbi:MAG: amidohydrolase [Acidobacteria bacterium]|nr:amidohydrolase [Acidobacteriota bacterium]
MKKASSGFYLERRIRGIPALVDLELRFRIMDAFEEYSQVLTIASPPLELLARPKDAGELARVANDELAELVAKYPSRFPAAIAALPLNDIDASLEELERAVTKLGLKGAQIYTHINGKPLDAPEVRPLFEKIAQYDLPLFLHPARGMDFPDYPTEKASRYEVWHVFGWPYDSTVAVTRILFTGIFDQYPNLKIVTHHMGGMVPFFEERIRGAYDQFGTRSGEDRGLKDRLKKHPYEYYRMFYADTSLYGSIPAMECALAFFGSDHVVFATDMPFDSEGGTRYIRQTLKAMEGMTASIEDKQKIYESNIRSLLKM